MWQLVKDTVEQILGLGKDAANLGFSHMAARAVVVFIFSVLLIRLADRRLFGHAAGFDIIVAIVLGSVLSRGINGQAAFFPTLVASGLLVVFHAVLASLTFRSRWFSSVVKGQPCTLVKEGQLQRDELGKNSITDEDLDEQLRLNGSVGSAAEVAEARLERNGSISVLKKKGG
jgi:uncharacterized membrane protein YcaP (DUF421 family)